MLTEYIRGMLWTEYRVPVTLLPTMDWAIEADGQADTRFADTNCLVPGAVDAKKVTASTVIGVPKDCASWIKIICRKPIRATLDGQEIINSADYTAEIPAYHRADMRKCAEVSLSKGDHLLTVEMDNATADGALYVYVVEGVENYWALQIDKTFSKP